MKSFLALLLLLVSPMTYAQDKPCSDGKTPFAMAMHGGLGETQYSAEVQKQRKELMQKVLKEAQKKLNKGELSVDVIEAAIATLEDSGLFNSGKGAVANVIGEVTLDSSIMDGRDRSSGSIANFKTLKNPIHGARAALKAGNRFFVGPDAENFAADLIHEPKSYFINSGKTASAQGRTTDEKFGTIGAIALDRCGNLAAGTSTGGYPSKPIGRVGDSPLIGAATYAENGVCAVSTTGEGEYFIRTSAASSACAQIKYGKRTVQEAASDIIENQIAKLNGLGGMIVMNGQGEVAWPYRTHEGGLLRGLAKKSSVEIVVFDEAPKAK